VTLSLSRLSLWRALSWTLVLFTLTLLAAQPAAARNHESDEDSSDVEHPVDPELFKQLEFRNIGPYRGGRSTAVTGVPGHRDTFYMGTTGGGVWKTTDGGQTWRVTSDEDFGSASVGAVAVAPSDHNVVYAGTGSACPRGNISPGDGIYKSTDGGKSWKHVGLELTGQIGRIRVHPTDPDTVYVAALGQIFGPNEERGVYRSQDGGESWEKVLFVSDRAGAVDLAMNPENPRILFAAIWEAERKPWTLVSGGEESGLYRSKDGGDSWDELTDGLPEGTKGRIGVSVSGGNPNRVFALVEAEKGGLFRSENGGDKFFLVNPDRNFRQRAWYYTHVVADPVNTENVYIMNTGLWRSTDGGNSFNFIRVPHGDNHDLWISPDDPDIMINANDGGANVSYNGGRAWSTQTNQPTAEMYRVTVDDQFPYRVYGCQQDNSCVSLPSRTGSGGIARHHWYVIGGCESGHVAVDPRNPKVTYSGCYGGQIGRYDHETGQEREIMAYPQLAVGQAATDLKYRFQWNAPIRLSPHDPSVLYHASQFLHRSNDEGHSWEIISPDLSRNNPDTLGYAGEPITRDNTGVEVYATIFAFEESQQTPGLLWVGTDDGRVHISRDSGENWEEVTPSGMPEDGQVNSLDLSAHDPGRAFLAVTRYKFNDFKPYIFRTDDYGATWTQLAEGSNGIPEDHFVRVVREDPDRKGLLFAGTEFGLYVSFDDGARWQPFQQKLPVTPVTDMQIKHGDLIVATQGRSFWVLDDLTPLHQLTDEVAGAAAHLFEPRPTHRFGGGFSFGGGGNAGANPQGGVVLRYLLAEESEEELTLEILGDGGEVLRSFSSKTPEERAPNPFRRFMPPGFGGPKTLPTEAGMNKWSWDMRLKDAKLEKDAVLWGMGRGPVVPPGSYQARLSMGEWSQTVDFEIVKDPRLATTQADFEAQYELSKKAWEGLNESHAALARLRDVRTQVGDLAKRLEDAGKGEGVEDAAKLVKERLGEIEKKIYQTQSEATQDVLNFPPKLDNQFIALMGTIESSDNPPTAGSVERYEDLRAELDAILAELDTCMNDEVKAFSDLVATKEVPAVIVN
jgi:photosystem II stability/assembly factor-like uncharacterized protein